MSSRRRFVVSLASLAAFGLVGCDRNGGASTGPDGAQPGGDSGATGKGSADGKKRILVLGGTGFLGPHFVRSAQAKGHELTLFNRGKTNPHLFPDTEKLVGDRDGKLDALKAEVDKGRRWDVVVDTSGYVPRIVRDSATLLAEAADYYMFISSISVYADPSKAGLGEADDVGKLDDPSVEEVTGETYGPLKALCEEAAEEVFPGKACRIRPGLIVGPGDPTDRYTYWPVRVSEGGKMIAPGNPDDPVQLIDARDLADWMVVCSEQGHTGIYNAAGPETVLTIEQLLAACAEGTEASPELVWIDAEFLGEKKVEPWMHMTVWVPPDSDFGGMGSVQNAAAVGAGLKFRPQADTARDTLAWWREQDEERRAKPRAGLARDRETEVLAAWAARDAKPGKAAKKKKSA